MLLPMLECELPCGEHVPCLQRLDVVARAWGHRDDLSGAVDREADAVRQVMIQRADTA